MRLVRQVYQPHKAHARDHADAHLRRHEREVQRVHRRPDRPIRREHVVRVIPVAPPAIDNAALAQHYRLEGIVDGQAEQRYVQERIRGDLARGGGEIRRSAKSAREDDVVDPILYKIIFNIH